MKTIKNTAKTARLLFWLLSRRYRITLVVVYYRMAQNKIPHRTICNISAINGLILKILAAA